MPAKPHGGMVALGHVPEVLDMTDWKRRTLGFACLMIVAGTGLGAPALAIPDPVILLQKNGVNIQPFDVSVDIAAPHRVAQGHDFRAMVNVTLKSIGAVYVNVLPIDDAGDQCALSSISAESPSPVSGTDYLLVNWGPSLDPVREELAFRTTPPYVRLALGYTTDAAAGYCNVHVNVTQPLFPLVTQPVEAALKVALQAATIPLFMGSLVSQGGPTDLDEATVVVSAAPDFPYPLVAGVTPKLTLTGTVSHHDGIDYGDFGAFWFTGPNVDCGHTDVADDTDGQVVACTVAIPYDSAKEVDSTYCFEGHYVDGGAYDTWEEPHAQTCTVVKATPVDPQRTRDDLIAKAKDCASRDKSLTGNVLACLTT